MRFSARAPLDEEGGSRAGGGSAVRSEYSPAGYDRIIAQDPGTGAALPVNSRLDESALAGDYHGLDPVP
jgi:hypothetical protein